MKAVVIDEVFHLASYQDPGFGSDQGREYKNILSNFLGAGNTQSRKTKLGRQLARHIDCVFGEYKLLGAGTSHGSRKYRLDSVDDMQPD